MTHPLQVAPCGECRELVSRLSGCSHWRPATAAERAAKARAGRERFSRSKRNAEREAAREPARDFRRSMGLEPR